MYVLTYYPTELDEMLNLIYFHPILVQEPRGTTPIAKLLHKFCHLSYFWEGGRGAVHRMLLQPSTELSHLPTPPCNKQFEESSLSLTRTHQIPRAPHSHPLNHITTETSEVTTRHRCSSKPPGAADL